MPYEIDWKIVIPIILAIFGLFTTLIFKRYELINHKSKHYSDRLDSSIRYFKDFFDSTEYNQIVLDRSAQDLARCKSMNANLTNRLIEYHQNYLVDFDKMINLFDNGLDYLIYIKKNKLDVKGDLQLKPSKVPMIIRSPLYNIGYVTFFFLGSFFIFLLTTQSFELLRFIFNILMCIFSFIASLGCLMLDDKSKSAREFIKLLYEAEDNFNALPRKISIIVPRGQSLNKSKS